KHLVPSVTPSWSPANSPVEATVRLAAGSRHLAFVRSRFRANAAETDVADHPLHRPYYELGQLQFLFPDDDFFARHGAEIIAGGLTPHAREIDWKREAANVVTKS